MASLYKRKQDKGNKRTCWYIGYTDHQGERQTRKGFTDKSATERLAASLEQDAQMIRSGIKSVQTVHEKNIPLNQHLLDFEKHLENRDVSSQQQREVISRTERLLKLTRWTSTLDVNPTDLENVLGELRGEGMSKQTSNHYLRAVKQFCRWLKRTKRVAENPIADISMLNTKTDRRHDRRALLLEEFNLLTQAAEKGKMSKAFPAKIE